MFRSIVAVLMYLTITTAAVAGQQTIGVGAVVLERVEAMEVDLEVRSVRGGLTVQAAQGVRPDARLLESTFVSVTREEPVATTAERILDGGTLRIEQRPVRMDLDAGQILEPGESLLLEGVERLTVTRVVASNS